MMKIGKLSFALVLLLGIVAGCSNQSSPVDPATPAGEALGKAAATVSASGTGDVTEILWPAPLPQAYALDSVKIVAGKGGALLLRSYNYTMSNGRVFKVSFTVVAGPNAVNKDVTLKFNLDPNAVGLQCTPEGTKFSAPILIGLQITGLGTLSLPTDAQVGFYYADPTNKHEKMLAKSVWVDQIAGNIGTIDASIPHFSKFTFAR
jgi:hypothetical protein